MRKKQETPPIQGGASGTLLGGSFRKLDSTVTEGAPVAFAVAVIASRYGMSLPWAEVVAAAAGLGERLS